MYYVRPHCDMSWALLHEFIQIENFTQLILLSNGWLMGWSAFLKDNKDECQEILRYGIPLTYSSLSNTRGDGISEVMTLLTKS